MINRLRFASAIAITCFLFSVTCPTSFGGVIYAVTGASGEPSSLYMVDPNSGAATLVGATGFSHVTGLEFDSSTGKLFGVVSDIDGPGSTKLLELNAATGAGTSIGTTGHQIPDLTSGADGVLRGWSEVDGGSLNDDDPIVINKGTGAVTSTLSGLSTAHTGVATLDATHIIVKPGTSYYSVDVNTGSSSFLYSSVDSSNLLENWNGDLLTGYRDLTGTQWYGIDIVTGASTTLGFTSEIRFSAVTVADPVVPEPTTLAIFGFGALCVSGLGMRRRRTQRV